MKNRHHKYLEVDVLPDEAMTIYSYAKKRKCNTSYIYKLAAMKRNGKETKQDTRFDIVVFKDINFVIEQ